MIRLLPNEMKIIAALILILVLIITAAGCGNRTPVAPYASDFPTDAPIITEAAASSSPTEPTKTDEPTPAPTEDPYAALPEEYRELGDFAKSCVLKAMKKMDSIIRHISSYPIGIGGSPLPFVPQDRFSKLTEVERSLYAKLYESAKGFAVITFEYEDDEAVGRVLEALHIDHPETEICFTVKKDENASYRTVIFAPGGRYLRQADDIEEVKAQVEAFEAVAGYVAGCIPDDFSAIDKYRAIACYVSSNTTYLTMRNEEMPPYATDAYGAVVNGYSICQGYSFGFEYLCRTAGLACRRLTNGETGEEMHYWNEVTLKGGTYYVDVTWSDGSSSYLSRDWFDWFLFTADAYHVSDDCTRTTGPEFRKESWK